MRIILFPYCYYPDPLGGTEIYVSNLSMALGRMGHSVIVAAPSWDDQEKIFYKDNIKIVKYRFPPIKKVAEIYHKSYPALRPWFERWFKTESPDILHFHASTRGQAVEMYECGKDLNIPIVLTYHTPAVTCLHGDMMLFGKTPCNGFLDVERCTACVLHDKGLPAGMARLVAKMPAPVSEWFAGRGDSKITTVLGMKEFVREHMASVMKRFKSADRIVAVCQWIRNVLLINGIQENRILFSRQGIPGQQKTEGCNDNKKPHTLVVGYLGRMNRAKGVDVLLGAVRLLPRHVPVRCEIYGVIQSKDDERYGHEMKKMAKEDDRICFYEAVPSTEVPRLMRRFDLLAVPSCGMETGPLVVMEAFAAGVPVIGSNVGGIAELVEHGVNGLLLGQGDLKAWSRTLQQFADDPQDLIRLREGIKPPKTMEQIAGEMENLYGVLLKQKADKGVLGARPA